MERRDVLGNEIKSDCIGCSIVNGEIELPGGVIYDGKGIILAADPEIPIPGFLIITSKRHIRSFAELTVEERMEIGNTIALAENAIKDLGIAETVTLVQEERSKHFHIWIFPEQDWMKEKFGLGIRYMRDINSYARENATKEDVDKVIKTAAEIREYMMHSASAICDEYVIRSKEILGEKLVGVYLHGSAVMGCFNPKKSDLDFIVVTDGEVSDDVKRKYMDMVLELNERGPAKGIEMSMVAKDACKPFVYPTPFQLHFSQMHIGWYRDNPEDYIAKMKGTDKDLAAHFTIIGKRGRCLFGAPIEEVFGEVPSEDYMDSIREDIADAPEDIESNTMYLALNLARVLAYKKEGLILSKKEGGEWGIRNLPGEYSSFLEDALKEYETAETVSYDMDLAGKYAKFMLEAISAPIVG